MKILLTGGNGFIGGHLARLLLKEGHLVTIIDQQALPERSDDLANVNFYQLDAGDSKCDKIFAGASFDYVIHLAEDEPDLSDSHTAALVLKANQAGLANILALSLKHQVRKLVYLSSYEVYGPLQDRLIQEDSQLRPSSLSGLGHQVQEMQCQEYRQLGLDVLVLRLSQVLGPHYTSFASLQLLVEKYLARSAQQEASLGFLDLIYITDVTQAVLASLEQATAPVLNIASGQASQGQQLGKSLCTELAELYARQPQNNLGAAYDPAELLNHTCLPFLQASPDEKKQAAAPVISIARASRELSWQPQKDLPTAIHKTISWHYQTAQINQQRQTQPLEPDQAAKIRKKMPRFVDTILFGLLTLAVSYLFQYQLAIKADLFLLYIALIGLFYGLGQGLLAVSLALAARVFFLLVLDRQQALFLTMSVDLVVQASLYILLGLSIGYAAENRATRQENTRHELESLKDELSFSNILYQKNLQIKSKLQAVIESNENSLGRLIHLFSRLEKADLESAYAEIASILADILKVGTVMIYSTDAPGNWFRLVAQAGEAKYLASFQAGQYDFIADVISKRQTYINTELRQGYPLLCTPLYAGEMLEAVIFIDGIEFINLTQHFLNTLKSLTALLSISIEQKYQLENKISSDKFIPGTAIVQKDWFLKIAQQLQRRADNSLILLKLGQTKDLGHVSRLALGLIRPTDLIGELDQGRLGIIMFNLDREDLQLIKTRFARHGLDVAAAAWKEEFAWQSSS